MKKILITAFVCIASLSAFPQLDGLSSLFPNNQPILEEAIQNGLVLIKQTYQLYDSTANKYYGRAGNDYYGFNYSMGFKMKNGIYFFDEAAHPWNYDDYFTKYKDQYTPVIYETSVREWTDTNYVVLDNFYNEKYPILKNNLYQNRDENMSEGFVFDSVNDAKQGWVVLAGIRKNAVLSDTMPVHLVVYRLPFIPNEDLTPTLIALKDNFSTFFGGIYFVPVITGFGKVTFQIAGVIRKVDGKGMLFSFATQKKRTPDEDLILTPVEKNKEGKEDNKGNNQDPKKKNKDDDDAPQNEIKKQKSIPIEDNQNQEINPQKEN